MPISPQQIQAVQENFEGLKGDAKTNGVMWFTWMLENYPEMRSLYRFIQSHTDLASNPDLARHAARVYKKLAVSIDQLSNRRVLAADLKTLGARHPGYGVVPDKHIKPTFEGLFYMIEKQSSTPVSVELRQAYEKAFDLICNSMGLYV